MADALTGRFPEAARLLGDCFSDIYALDDIGRRFVGNPFVPTTMAQAVMGITASIRSNVQEAEEILAAGNATEARCAALEVLDVLGSLDEFMLMATDGGDGLNVSEKTAGGAIYDLTVRVAKAIETAEIACGGFGSGGYLDGGDVRHDPNRPYAKGKVKVAVDAEAEGRHA